jgi:ketosteroid isomerase-like protein
MTDRTAYIEGLRTLADALENEPELPLPYHGTTSAIATFPRDREAFYALIRLLDDRSVDVKDVVADVRRVMVSGAVHGLRVLVYGDAAWLDSRVCTETVERREYDLTGLTS